MIPDSNVQAGRIKKAISFMVVSYQEKGEYLDLDGKKHQTTEGIVSAWEELDLLTRKKV